MHYSYFGPLWKQSGPLIHCSCYWAPFESKVTYFAHCSCKGGSRQVPRLPSLKHTTVQYISLTMILYENMKPIEHVLLHPICVLSHLMCACKNCNVKSSLYEWTHWSFWWVYHFKKHRYHAISHNNLDQGWANSSLWVKCGPTQRFSGLRKHSRKSSNPKYHPTQHSKR